jgi:hypothetical protein
VDFSNPVSAVIPSLEGRVLLALSHAAVPMSGSRIASLVPGASNPGVRKALARLVEHGTVLAERSSHAVLYRANREHLAWAAIAATAEFAATARETLGERVLERVQHYLGVHHAQRTTVALYGSVARGTGDEHSDLDLVLLTPVEDEPLVLDVTAGVERWTGNLCSIYELTPARLSDLVRRSDPIVRSWLDDAVTLTGPDLRRLLLLEGARP